MFVNEESGVEGLCLDCALSGVVSIAGVLERPLAAFGNPLRGLAAIESHV